MVRNEEGVGGKLFGLLLPRNPCDSVALCDSVRTDFLTRVVGRPCSSFSGAEKVVRSEQCAVLLLMWHFFAFEN